MTKLYLEMISEDGSEQAEQRVNRKQKPFLLTVNKLISVSTVRQQSLWMAN